jgi:hypothetical protein
VTLLEQRANLLERTKQVRFFRGQLYDAHADEYLRELQEFLLETIEWELKIARMQALLLRASIYISAEQRMSGRPQGAVLLTDIEAVLK